jgi:hypothetical protein
VTHANASIYDCCIRRTVYVDRMSHRIACVWLQLAALVTILTGLISAAASHPSTAGLWLWLFDLLQWPLDGNPAQFSPEAYAVNGVLGGVMVGWGVLMLLLARGPIRSGQSESAKFLLIGIIAWFIVDSSASFAANIPGNVVLNVLFLVMFAPPLVRLLQTR